MGKALIKLGNLLEKLGVQNGNYKDLTDIYKELEKEEEMKILYEKERNTEIEKFLEVSRRNIEKHTIPRMEDLEIGLREAALRDGAKALSKVLEDIPEKKTIPCNKCSSEMKFIDTREKGLTSLLGETTLKRNYYECINPECKNHSFPKDTQLDVKQTSFSPRSKKTHGKGRK